MTPPPPRAELEDVTLDGRSTTAAGQCTTDNGRAAAMTTDIRQVGADNVAYFCSTADDHDDRSVANGNGLRQPDRHQLPPSALTPVQFEMNYGTPPATTVAAGDDNNMSSKDNLLMPRG